SRSDQVCPLSSGQLGSVAICGARPGLERGVGRNLHLAQAIGQSIQMAESDPGACTDAEVRIVLAEVSRKRDRVVPARVNEEVIESCAQADSACSQTEGRVV